MNMNTTAKLLCALTLLIAALAPARAGSPEYINYQGLLNGADGQPLPTTNYVMEFNIYDQANGGAKQWGPFLFDGGAGNGHGPLVPVANGRFNVIIGPKDTTGASIVNAFNNTNRFVEIKVNNGSPILPRQQFLSTPYAFKANTADSAASATVAATVTDVNVAYINTANTFTGNQTVNGTAIINGSVTATGNVTAGGSGVAVGEENLRIVRGIVRGTTASSLNKGSGYTVSSFGGTTVINFATSFLDLPTVTVTAENAPEAWHFSVVVTTSGVTVTSRRADSVVQTLPFHFIAIGPR